MQFFNGVQIAALTNIVSKLMTKKTGNRKRKKESMEDIITPYINVVLTKVSDREKEFGVDW